MKRRTRMAVVGAGLIGWLHGETALRRSDREVVAIFDPSAASEVFARDHGLSGYFNHQALFDDSQRDGVIVATPNATHVEIALACIARALPVPIEKPIADSAEEAARLASIDCDAAVPVLVGHHAPA